MEYVDSGKPIVAEHKQSPFSFVKTYALEHAEDNIHFRRSRYPLSRGVMAEIAPPGIHKLPMQSTFLDHSAHNLRFNSPRRAKYRLSIDSRTNQVENATISAANSGNCKSTKIGSDSTLTNRIKCMKQAISEELKLSLKHSHLKLKPYNERIAAQRNNPSELCFGGFQGVKSFQQFLDLAFRNKHISEGLQSFILTCSEDTITELSGYCIRALEQLVFHKLGGYVVQRLILRSLHVRQAIKDWSEASFCNLVSNEFSSRVMQTLAEVDPEFRSVALGWFYEKWSILSERMGAVFFLSACLRIGINEVEMAQLRDLLFSDTFKLIRSKHLKRVLVSFVQVCSNEDLEIAYNIIRRHVELVDLFHDKNLTFAAKFMFERGLPSINHDLTSYFKEAPLQFTGATYFFLFLLKLEETDLNLFGKSQLFESILSIVINPTRLISSNLNNANDFKSLAWFVLDVCESMESDSTLQAVCRSLDHHLTRQNSIIDCSI